MERKNSFKFGIYLTLTLLLCIPLFSFAEEQEEVTRKIDKVYSITHAHILEIKNKYGDVEVYTWEKKHAEVSITIISKASTQEKAQSRIDEVDIRERSFGQKIQLETRIDGNNLLRYGVNSGVNVNYKIFIPASNPLEIENKFGNVILEDRNGNVSVDLNYGDLTAGALNGQGNRLHLQFGKTDIRYVQSGDIDFSFGGLRVDEAGMLYLKSNASEVTINKVESLELYANMGEIHINEAGDVAGNYTSSKFTIGKLNQSLDMEVKYATKFEVREIAPEVEKIDIHGNFSSFDLYLDPNANVNIDAKMENGELILPDQTWIQVDSFETETRQTRYMSKGVNTTSRMARPPIQVNVENKFGNVRVHRKE